MYVIRWRAKNQGKDPKPFRHFSIHTQAKEITAFVKEKEKEFPKITPEIQGATHILKARRLPKKLRDALKEKGHCWVKINPNNPSAALSEIWKL